MTKYDAIVIGSGQGGNPLAHGLADLGDSVFEPFVGMRELLRLNEEATEEVGERIVVIRCDRPYPPAVANFICCRRSIHRCHHAGLPTPGSLQRCQDVMCELRHRARNRI